MANQVLPDKLMNSVLGNLYDVLTSGDDVAPRSKDNYLSWLSPGVPYPPEELEFLKTGFTGIYREKELQPVTEEGGVATQSRQKTPEEIEQLRAQDATRKYMQAENLAQLSDILVDTSGVKDDVTMNVWNPENSISQAYRQILKFSQVADIQPDEKTKAKIKRLRGLLQEKKTKKNIVTEEEEEVLEETPMVKKYNEKMQQYMNEALEYNNHRVNALAAKDPTAVHFWSMNASILRNKVRAAKRDWKTNGFKAEYEQIADFISQVEGRSMVSLKAQYLDDMGKSVLTGPASGADFFYTSLLPGGFADTDNGWTEFTFDKSDYASNYNFDSKKGNGGFSLGGIIGGAGSFEKKKIDSKIDVSQFKLSFRMCQVPICRPWFNINFLISKYWRFAQNNPEFKDNMVSDGEKPPQGMIPAVPTTAIFIRDLHLHFGQFNSQFQSEMKKIGGGGFGFWGPINLGGKYESQSVKRDFKRKKEDQGIEVKGMQLIGFKCHMLPLSPDPNPDIKSWV